MKSPAAFAREFVAEPLRQAAQERDDVGRSPNRRRADWQVAVVLVSAAALLTLRSYQPGLATVFSWLGAGDAPPDHPLAGLHDLAFHENAALSHLIFWSVWQFLAYALLPALIVKLVLRRPLADCGLKLRGMFRCWWAYAAMYLIVLPAVWVVSHTASFQHTYPFLRPTFVVEGDNAPAAGAAGGGDAEEGRIAAGYWQRFGVWQVFYALQFVSLEFFFRGYLLHGTRRRLGAFSILVMTVPYCMIHFGKPLLETLGAIVAGVVLGFMSLKTRSIWLGAALHIAVAVTMDLMALWQNSS